jgi:hypothetical protein
LNDQQKDLEHQLPSLEVAANPKKEELKKVKELEQSIAVAESEMLKLTKSSRSLREKVELSSDHSFYICLFIVLYYNIDYNLHLSN